MFRMFAAGKLDPPLSKRAVAKRELGMGPQWAGGAAGA